MPVVLVHQGPTLTRQRYDQAVKRLSGARRKMRSPADWPVPGLLIHAARTGPEWFPGRGYVGVGRRRARPVRRHRRAESCRSSV